MALNDFFGLDDTYTISNTQSGQLYRVVYSSSENWVSTYMHKCALCEKTCNCSHLSTQECEGCSNCQDDGSEENKDG